MAVPKSGLQIRNAKPEYYKSAGAGHQAISEMKANKIRMILKT